MASLTGVITLLPDTKKALPPCFFCADSEWAAVQQVKQPQYLIIIIADASSESLDEESVGHLSQSVKYYVNL